MERFLHQLGRVAEPVTDALRRHLPDAECREANVASEATLRRAGRRNDGERRRVVGSEV